MAFDEASQFVGFFLLAIEFRVDVNQAFQRNVAIGVVQAEAGGGVRASDLGTGGFEDRFGQIVELVGAAAEFVGDVGLTSVQLQRLTGGSCRRPGYSGTPQ